jgi:dCMP deaminase
MKRQNYISWDDMFMCIAAIASMRSKDPNTQNGACIIDPTSKKILSVGYNGFPRGCSDDEFPWEKGSPDNDPCKSKYQFVVHAERNALDNRQGPINGSVLYLYSERGYYPCSACAQGVIQNGISEVVMAFATDEPTETYDWRPTKMMFKAAGVTIRILKDFEDRFDAMAKLMGNCATKIVLKKTEKEDRNRPGSPKKP